MKITLLTPGKIKHAFFTEAAAEFSARVARFCAFETCEVREQPLVKNSDIPTTQEKEAETLRQKIPAKNLVVCLDKAGKMPDSEGFAHMIAQWEASGKDVTIVIGGAVGLADSILREADTCISLGKITLTQDLARVVLTEQLFRGFTILRGIPFHK